MSRPWPPAPRARRSTPVRGCWDARFAEAQGLTYWPPALGKQGEAIENFEQLVAQQSSVPSQPKHVDVHIMLGNMCLQMGKPDKAISAWKVRLEAFPGNSQLQQQLAAALDG